MTQTADLREQNEVFQLADKPFMKTITFASVACLLGMSLCASAEDLFIKEGADFVPSLEDGWELVFSDEFNNSSLNTTNWGRIQYENGWTPSNTTWVYYQSQDESLVSNTGSCLKLSADYGDFYNQKKYQENGWQVVDNENTHYDTYACGGVDTKNTFTFKYGYVEVKAAFTHQAGLWPAIWMMPKGGSSWPSSGEIDIMEHLMYEESVYQTLHHVNTSGAASSTTASPRPSISDEYGGADMHVYGMKWTEEYIEFYVDGERTAIMRASGFESRGQVWPFGADSKDFYLILDQQLTTVSSWQTGYSTINEAALQQAIEDDQAYMLVDYVKVYSADYTYYNLPASVPEPATATLSLLALVGLAARRRRR